ncbi:hypothetical protein BC829DRAFT_393118 [Chytridium lagenaria]|nr:hypothetical protein BC829DRAFT_393118 [Chytridium lagenaria]
MLIREITEDEELMIRKQDAANSIKEAQEFKKKKVLRFNDNVKSDSEEDPEQDPRRSSAEPEIIIPGTRTKLSTQKWGSLIEELDDDVPRKPETKGKNSLNQDVSGQDGRSASTSSINTLVETGSLTLPPTVNIKREDEEKFKFTFVENAKFAGFQDKETQALLFKWGMQDHCYMKRFSYDKLLQSLQIKSFLLDFFNDPTNASPVTSLDFFDRLKSNVFEVPDEYIDGFVVSDELRRCLLMEEFESYDIFSGADRKEFIFHFEDEVEPYLTTTKKIYKDLMTVTKDSTTGKLRVSSLVYKITNAETAHSPLFPVNVFYHASDVYY